MPCHKASFSIIGKGNCMEQCVSMETGCFCYFVVTLENFIKCVPNVMDLHASTIGKNFTVSLIRDQENKSNEIREVTYTCRPPCFITSALIELKIPNFSLYLFVCSFRKYYYIIITGEPAHTTLEERGLLFHKPQPPITKIAE